MLSWIVAGAMAATLSACPEDQVVNPDWLEKPSGDDVAWAYPPQAAEEGLPGLATVHCELNIDGIAENCLAVGEEPRGRGFGEAAILLTKFMRFSAKRECGAKVRGSVSIPIRFVPPDGLVELSASPENKALARRLLVAMGEEEALNDRFEYELQFTYGVFEGDGKLSVDHRRAAFEAAKETWAGAKEETLEPLIMSYAARLSTEDLQRAVDFYESEAGKAVVLQRRRQVVLSITPVVTPALVKEFGERYCARVLPCEGKPPDER